MKPGLYQNAGDWTWMGARMVQQLVKHNMLDDALQELRPFVDRVCEDKDFREWYDPQVLIARLHQTGLIFLIISLLMHSIGIATAVSRVQWVFCLCVAAARHAWARDLESERRQQLPRQCWRAWHRHQDAARGARGEIVQAGKRGGTWCRNKSATRICVRLLWSFYKLLAIVIMYALFAFF